MGSATLPPTGLVGKMWSIEKQSETKIPSEVRLLSISISRTAQGCPLLSLLAGSSHLFGLLVSGRLER